ncbi:MAG: D-alanyl-D-alanine carboxypeptidase [Betaproteobacteria bacterium]|nr:D-alanyl-D-alanine carboxypeptidase [Betaproteobacteria bacterium]
MRRTLLILLALFSALSSRGDGTLTAPYIAAHAYYLLEVESGQPLAALNPDQRVEPASLTKLMTAYLTFKALREKTLSPAQTVPVSQEAWKAAGSRMFIDPMKAVTVDELIHGVIIQSGNDASIALAQAIAGSEDAFVERMNKQAAELGMTNTHFANATGLPHPQHYSTAHDLALLSEALIRDYPEYYPLYAIKEYRYNGITQPNRNRLLWIDNTVDGLKTGHTETAGYCLISSAHRGDRRLLAVVLGTNSDLARTTESQKLLNWGFQTFESQRLFQKDAAVRQLPVFKGSAREVRAGFQRDIWMTYPAGDGAKARQTLMTLQPIVAPVAAGQKLGTLEIRYDDKAVAVHDLVALEPVPIGNAFTRGWDTIRLMLK